MKKSNQEMRARLRARRKGIVISLAVTCVTLLILKGFRFSSLPGFPGSSASIKTGILEHFRSQEIAARFERRRHRLQEACRRLNVSSDYWGMRHADQRFIFPTNTTPTVLYCPVPKTGTTFLKKTFAEANKMSRVIWIDRFNVRPVEDYDKAIMFFFTREPYSRILSAYVDKLWSPNLHFWRVLGRQLVRKVRLHASRTSLECGHDVTFTEFIRYFIQGMARNVRINTHLVPTHKFCEACAYDYDYIGNLETFREDAAYILSVINVTSSQSFVNDDDIITEHVAQAYYTDFYDRKKCEKKHNVLLRAWRALQIRGLISMTIAFPFSERMSSFLGREVFNITVYRAVRESEKLMRNLDDHLSQSTSSMESRAKNPSQSKFSLTARAIQKRMALASAYTLIPMADRMKMMELFWEEFELFGYEPKPKDVFAPAFPLNPKIFDFSNI